MDKYFLAPFARDLSPFSFFTNRENVSGSGTRRLRRLGPHLFAFGQRAVLLRHCTPAEMKIITSGRFPPSRLHYVIDDDLAAIAADQRLPAAYRQRVRAFMTDMLPHILRACGHIAAPSRNILNAYPGHEHALLHPCILKDRKSFRHFNRGKGGFRMIFTGTASHARDLEMIAREVRRFCAAHDDATLVTFLGGQAPDALKRIKNIYHIRPLRWPFFRYFLEHASFHVALAPMQGTAVNQARSFNKILDHAVLGAAGVYSANVCPAISDKIVSGENGLLVQNSPGAWREKLEELYAERGMTQRLAKAGAATAARIGSQQRVRNFWRRRLLTSP